jgi:predicted transcriptional regulator of viral defense system
LKGFALARSRDTARALLEIANRQGGYFTAQQAHSIGYAYSMQTYHVTHGNWIRVARGIYRLHGYPTSDRDDLIILSLLSSDRAGQAQAVVSHETALSIYELSDANPARIHLTVPPGFRRRLPHNVILHRGHVSEEDWEEHEGYRVTTPLRTLRDIAESPSSWPYLNDAVREALRRGLVRRSNLTDAKGSDVMKARLHEAVAAAEQQVGS